MIKNWVGRKNQNKKMKRHWKMRKKKWSLIEYYISNEKYWDICVWQKLKKYTYIVSILSQSFVWDKCMMEFRSKRTLHNHKKTCSGITTYKCSDCTKFFVSIESLIQHTKKFHMVRKILISQIWFAFFFKLKIIKLLKFSF